MRNLITPTQESFYKILGFFEERERGEIDDAAFVAKVSRTIDTFRTTPPSVEPERAVRLPQEKRQNSS